VGSPNDPALLELEHLPADGTYCSTSADIHFCTRTYISVTSVVAIVVAAGETIEELQASGDPSFADANVLLNVSGSRATLAPILRHLPHLVWVHSLTAGVDHILCPALVDDETITLTNAKGLYSSSLAEYVLAAASYFAKDFPRLARNKASKTWDRYCVQELRGATMGIVGYGSIGQACARLAKAYGMKVVGLRRYVRSLTSAVKMAPC
jgi:phosphoglycerate dehydrogenase-like enzyme